MASVAVQGRSGRGPAHRSALGKVWHAFTRTGDWWHHALLIVLLFLMFVPIFMMIIISFKTLAQFQMQPYLPTFPLHPEGYARAFQVVSKYIWNSLIVSDPQQTALNTYGNPGFQPAFSGGLRFDDVHYDVGVSGFFGRRQAWKCATKTTD